MSDLSFQRALTAVTAVAVAWVVLGIVFGVMGWFLVVVTGLLFEMVVGGALLYIWGKSYMSRL